MAQQTEDAISSKKHSEKRAFIEPSTYKVVYDFRKGEYLEKLKKIRVHTPVVFEIRNINPFAYFITIARKDSILAPSSFDDELITFIKGKAFENTEKQIEQAQAIDDQKINNVTSIKKDDIVGGDEKKDSIYNSLGYIAEINLLKEKKELIKDSLSFIGTKIVDFELKGVGDSLQSDNLLVADSIKKLTEFRAKYHQFDSVFKTLNSRIQVLNRKVETDLMLFNSLQSNFINTYSQFVLDCKQVFKALRDARMLNTIAEDPNLTIENYDRNYREKLNKTVSEIKNYRDALNLYKASYSELTNAYFRLKNDPYLDGSFTGNGITKLYSYPDYIKSKADGLYARINQYPIDDIIKYTDWIANKLTSENPFNYISDPIQPVNDLIEFKIDIKKRNKMASDVFYTERSFVFQQPTFGGTRVDFSLGLAASYFFDAPTYSLAFTPDSDSQELVITEDSKDLVAGSLVGLITMSRRQTKYIAWGGSAGLGIDVLNGKIQISNFFIGPTILFGKKDRIFFTAGPALRNIGKLKSGYNVGYNVGKVTEISSFIADKYKVGWFVSLSYSLTKDAKQMIKSFR